jgi:hypothetical protein
MTVYFSFEKIDPVPLPQREQRGESLDDVGIPKKVGAEFVKVDKEGKLPESASLAPFG